MARTIVETSSHTVGGTNGRLDIVRTVQLTAGAAGDVANDVVIPASEFNLVKATGLSHLINASKQVLDLYPSFDQTGFVVKYTGTAPTVLVFKGRVQGQ